MSLLQDSPVPAKEACNGKTENQDLVKKILKLPPKEQESIMDEIRKEGINENNLNEMKQEKPNLMRERRQGKFSFHKM